MRPGLGTPIAVRAHAGQRDAFKIADRTGWDVNYEHHGRWRPGDCLVANPHWPGGEPAGVDVVVVLPGAGCDGIDHIQLRYAINIVIANGWADHKLDFDIPLDVVLAGGPIASDLSG